MRRITLVLIGLLLVAAACSTENQDKPSGSDGAGIPEAPPTQSAEPTDSDEATELVGTTWRLETMIDGNDTRQLPERATATLVLTRKGVQTNSGCNAGGGSVEIGDGTLEFGPLVTTLIACPEKWKQQVEQAYGEVLQGRATHAIEGDRLRIAKGDRSLEFVAR